MLNLIKNQQPDMDKICLYIKDPFELKYQLLINWREKVGIKKIKKSKYLFIITKQLMMFMKICKTLYSNKEKEF